MAIIAHAVSFSTQSLGKDNVERGAWLMFHLKQVGDASIALAKNRNIKRSVKPGRTDEKIVRYVSFARSSLEQRYTE
jgi:hypothetical protein